MVMHVLRPKPTTSAVNLDKIYTIEEYEALPEDGNVYELLEGKLLMTPPPGGDHAEISTSLPSCLYVYVTSRNLGKVYTNGRLVIERKKDKDTELAPDVAFLAFPAAPDSCPGAVPVPPDFAVEIKSPTDTLAKLKKKTRAYIRAGVKLAWIVIPEKRQVLVYRQETATPLVIIGDETEIDAASVLPDFKIRLKLLFPATRK
jgi:Uma2 family endonuclease